MATPDVPNFAEHLRTLPNQELVEQHLELADVCGGGDGQAMLLDFIEPRPEPTAEEYGTAEERLAADELPLMETTEDRAQYLASLRELVCRSIGHLFANEGDLLNQLRQPGQ